MRSCVSVENHDVTPSKSLPFTTKLSKWGSAAANHSEGKGREELPEEAGRGFKKTFFAGCKNIGKRCSKRHIYKAFSAVIVCSC